MSQFFHIPGRHQHLEGGLFSWMWPGVYAEFCIQGSAFELLVEGEGCQVRLSVDGQATDYGPLTHGPQKLHWKGEAGLHRVRLETTHEEFYFEFRWLSLHLSDSSLVEIALARKACIEFVGDSWTSGYGNLCEEQKSSDCTQAFAALAAMALDWDYSLVAASGQGLVKNYGDTVPSAVALPHRYNVKTQELRAQWCVVLLGENDFSQKPWPTEDAFCTAYRKLLHELRHRHPQVHILLLGIERGHPAQQLARRTFELETAQGARDIEFLEIPNLDPALPMGHQGHPGLAHHQAMAAQLVHYFQTR